MADPPQGDGAPEEIDDVELVPPAVRWLRVSLFLLVAATVVAIIGLGSEGRAAGVFGALSAGAERIGDGVGDIWDGTRNHLQVVAAAEPDRSVELQAPAGSFATVVVVEDLSGAAASVVLAVADPDGTATLVMFPRELTATVPGYGDFRLGDTTRFEDASLTALTLSNVLGIRIDATVGLTADELTAALASPIVVDLPTDAVVPSGDGVTLLAERGRAQLQPSVVTAVIVTEGEADPLGWLERQGAAWEAILTSDQAGAFIEAIAAHAGPGEDARTALTAAAAASSLSVGSPGVTTIGIGSDSQLVLRGADADAFVAARLSHLLIRDGERPRVEVLNGNGRPQTTRLVAETLVKRGFRVIRTDNADSFDYRDSRVIAQGRENRLPGAEIVGLLGVGQLELEVRAPSGVVDVSIIVGEDIPIGEGT
jgi:hypothetical protein